MSGNARWSFRSGNARWTEKEGGSHRLRNNVDALGGAAVTAKTQQSVNPLHWVTQWAPEPRDVDWPNMEIPYNQIFPCKIVATVLAIAITFIYYPIVLAVKVLENLDTVKKYLSQAVVDNVLDILAVSSFVQGYLPALLLAVILYICPSIFLSLSRFKGHPSVSHQQQNASSKMFSLLAGNIFLAAVLSGSLITISESFTEDPKSIPRRLAEAVPRQANFFIMLSMVFDTQSYVDDLFSINHDSISERDASLCESVPMTPDHRHNARSGFDVPCSKPGIPKNPIPRPQWHPADQLPHQLTTPSKCRVATLQASISQNVSRVDAKSAESFSRR